MGIELRQLRYFVAVAEELSITRAAGRLFLSQQALSAAIRQLEHRAGAVLLVRGPRGLEITPAGQTLLDHARRVLRGARAGGSPRSAPAG
jgi:DNA-binding transcriptional LysR family regulator